VTDCGAQVVWEFDGRLPVWCCDSQQSLSGQPRDAAAIRSVIDQHGLVLMRGFDLSAEQFLRWVRDVCGGWGFTVPAPSGGDPRSRLFTQSEVEQHMHEPRRLEEMAEKRGATTSGGPRIGLHSDMAHEPLMPAWTWFYVSKAADRGGETLLCDGAAIVSGLSDDALAFLSDDIMYVRRGTALPQSMDTPVTNDPPNMGRRYRRSIVELPDSSFEICAVARPIIRTRVGGQKVFGNRILGTLEEHHDDGGPPGAFYQVRTCERKPLPEHIISELRTVAESASFSVSLKDKEILCVDNTRFLHGREAYEGPRYVMFHLRFHPGQLTSHDHDSAMRN
jgi:alpha-ketoglutarate-dependent taurine dioxygenase